MHAKARKARVMRPTHIDYHQIPSYVARGPRKQERNGLFKVLFSCHVKEGK